jgi:hypothetical protein
MIVPVRCGVPSFGATENATAVALVSCQLTPGPFLEA